MVIKTFVMFALYFTPYILMLTGVVTGPWVMFAMCLIMGIGMAGIGLSVMHDANHGSYSNKSWINDLLGFSLKSGEKQGESEENPGRQKGSIRVATGAQ
jgi:linoleoyl-CoA desaturase